MPGASKLLEIADSRALATEHLGTDDWKTAGMVGMLFDSTGKSLLHHVAEALREDEKLLWGVVHNAGRLRPVATARWVAVREAVACGSTTAKELCKRFGADPDDTVGGIREQEPDEEVADGR